MSSEDEVNINGMQNLVSVYIHDVEGGGGGILAVYMTARSDIFLGG